MTEKKAFLLPQYSHLQKEYDAVVQCNRCGFCETVCPTYVATGKENLSPRGRNQAFRNILEGKLKDAESAKDIFSTCLTCHACTTVCFSQVPVGRLMGSAREIAGAPGPEKTIFKLLLFNRKIFSFVLWLGFLAKNTMIPRLLRILGVLKKISPELSAADELVKNAPLIFGAGASRGTDAKDKAVYFSGCGTHYVYPDACRAFLQVLDRQNVKVSCPSHACCGLIPFSAGDTETAKALALKNIEQFSSSETGAILVNDDSCAGFMKGYGVLFPGNSAAAAVAAKVKNLSEFLASRSAPQNAAPGTDAKIKVTYHDPCQMGNGQNSFKSPREVLKGVPGVEFVELEESGWCCGGAGTYCLKHPDLSEDVLERKLKNIKKSGAKIIVTQASSCLMHIEYGLRRTDWGKNVKIMHLSEFLKKSWKGFAALILFACLLSPSRAVGSSSTDTVSLLITGDVVPESSWGISFQPPEKIFEQVQSEFLDSDIVFINLEEPITQFKEKTPHKNLKSVAKGKDFILKAKNPTLPKIFKESGVRVVNLANNHVGDYQAQGVLDTLKGLREAGLLTVGAGANARQAYQAVKIEEKGMTVALLGFSDVSPPGFAAEARRPGIASSKDLAPALKALKAAKAEADYAVVMMHWGDHATSTPIARQEFVGRALVDAGADAVIGMHAHFLQPMENYNGKPIFYGLGNFAFPSRNPLAQETVMVKMLFKAGEKPRVELVPVKISREGQPKIVRGEEEGERILAYLDRISKSR